jgi:hypothetical protein
MFTDNMGRRDREREKDGMKTTQHFQTKVGRFTQMRRRNPDEIVTHYERRLRNMYTI